MFPQLSDNSGGAGGIVKISIAIFPWKDRINSSAACSKDTPGVFVNCRFE